MTRNIVILLIKINYIMDNISAK